MDRDAGSEVDILMVEDNPADMRLTVEALREGKVHNRLHWVKDGMEALAFLRQQGDYSSAPRPELILLDLNLPKKSGREVLEEIKQDDQLKRIPVVILTTSAAEEDIVRTYDLNANCYITKPVDFEKFVQVIRAIDQFWLGLVTLPSSERFG